MKITYRESGGFAGLTKSAEIESDMLSEEEAEALRSLVDKPQDFDISDPGREAMPDREQRSITVEWEGRSRTIHLGASPPPAALDPLVKNLAKRATYEKKKKK